MILTNITYKKIFVGGVVIVFTACLLGGAGFSVAATTPDLGQATSFGILASTYTNTVGGTTINGDVGYTTGPATAPTVNGTTYIADGTYGTAGAHQGSALNNLNAQPCTHTFPAGAVDLATDTSHGAIGVYTPGVYCTATSSAASIGAAGITLTGGGTYIFRIDGALTTVANSAVTLASGASACDVFWTPTGATTLGANSTFRGTDIDAAGITIGSTVTWGGRALAFGGTVSTDVDTITVPSCPSAAASSASSGTAGSGSGPGSSEPVPGINVTKAANPVVLPAGAGAVTYTYQVTNSGDLALSNVTLTDNTCSPAIFLSGDRNADSMMDLDELWTYRCTRIVSASVTNTATATGMASGVTVRDTANATVVVGGVAPSPVSGPVPGLPNTGIDPNSHNIPSWSNFILFRWLAAWFLF